ncbi:MAG: hypothetical protein ACTSUE_13965 [Promethearchaeota archaeon]
MSDRDDQSKRTRSIESSDDDDDDDDEDSDDYDGEEREKRLAKWIARIKKEEKIRRIVLICGKSGSGKDECARWLCKQRRFHSVRFAHKIKVLVAEMTGTSIVDNYWHKGVIGKGFEDIGSIGLIQQKLGGFGRTLHKDLWVIALWKDILKERVPRIVIADGRMKNEVGFFKDKGAFIVRINRPYHLRKSSLQGRDPNDITETDLDDYDGFDCVIENDTIDLKPLYSKFEKIFTESLILDTVHHESDDEEEDSSKK